MPTDHHDDHDAAAVSPAGSTRELNFGIISFVTILFVLLLIITITGATGWFRWEFNRAEARAAERGGLHADLVRLHEEQRAHTEGKLDAAVSSVAEEF